MDPTIPFDLEKGVILFSSGVGLLAKNISWDPATKIVQIADLVGPEVLCRNFLTLRDNHPDVFILTDENYNQKLKFRVSRVLEQGVKVLAASMLINQGMCFRAEPLDDPVVVS